MSRASLVLILLAAGCGKHVAPPQEGGTVTTVPVSSFELDPCPQWNESAASLANIMAGRTWTCARELRDLPEDGGTTLLIGGKLACVPVSR